MGGGGEIGSKVILRGDLPVSTKGSSIDLPVSTKGSSIDPAVQWERENSGGRVADVNIPENLPNWHIES